MEQDYLIKNFNGSQEDLETMLNQNGHEGCTVEAVSPEKKGFKRVKKNKKEQVEYDFDLFVQKAREYSEKDPPDVTQCCEKTWAAASLCVVQFYLEHFGICIKSHPAKRALARAIGFGCNGDDGGKIMETWTRAEHAHGNFYEMLFFTKDERNSLLDSIVEMREIVNDSERCNIDGVREEVNRLRSSNNFVIEPRRGRNQRPFKIAKRSFPFREIAH